MVDTSHPPLWIRPIASGRVKAWLLLSHAAAACAIPLSGQGLSFKLVVAGLTCLSIGYSWRRHVLLGGRAALRQACWESDGRWLLQDGRGDWRHVDDYRLVWSSPRIILVRFRKVWPGPDSLLVLSDAVPAELHRQLRVRLTLQSHSRPSEEGT